MTLWQTTIKHNPPKLMLCVCVCVQRSHISVEFHSSTQCALMLTSRSIKRYWLLPACHSGYMWAQAFRKLTSHQVCALDHLFFCVAAYTPWDLHRYMKVLICPLCTWHHMQRRVYLSSQSLFPDALSHIRWFNRSTAWILDCHIVLLKRIELPQELASKRKDWPFPWVTVNRLVRTLLSVSLPLCCDIRLSF